MSNTELHPSYLEVAWVIMEGAHSPGTLFTHEWLHVGLHIRMPADTELLTKAEHDRLELAYLKAVSQLREVLLEEHHIALKIVLGKGYEVLSPVEQIQHGTDKLDTSVRKGIKASTALLTHVDLGGLDAAACAQQANALAKAGTLAALLRKRNHLGSSAAFAALPVKTKI